MMQNKFWTLLIALVQASQSIFSKYRRGGQAKKYEVSAGYKQKIGGGQAKNRRYMLCKSKKIGGFRLFQNQNVDIFRPL